MTTGTCWSPFIGIWYCTYIWLTVISPDCAGIGPTAGEATVFFSPPTKKLPCSLIVSGGAANAASGAASVTTSSAMELERALIDDLPTAFRRIVAATALARDSRGASRNGGLLQA